MRGLSLNMDYLFIWFHLLTSIVVLENKIDSLAEGAWQSVLDCIDRFVNTYLFTYLCFLLIFLLCSGV